MKDNNIRKLPIISKKNDLVGMILQSVIANAIRNATATAPRLLSPPVKAILGNLGFVLQFAGVLLLIPAILATILEDNTSATGIYLTTVLLLVTGFFLNSYGEKSNLNLRQASILVFSSLFLLSLFGSIPYFYVFTDSDNYVEMFGNAFFSSAAGFTTGGISLFDEPEKAFSELYLLSQLHTACWRNELYLSCNHRILSRIQTSGHAWFYIWKNASHEGTIPYNYGDLFNLHCNCRIPVVCVWRKKHY